MKQAGLREASAIDLRSKWTRLQIYGPLAHPACRPCSIAGGVRGSRAIYQRGCSVGSDREEHSHPPSLSVSCTDLSRALWPMSVGIVRVKVLSTQIWTGFGSSLTNLGQIRTKWKTYYLLPSHLVFWTLLQSAYGFTNTTSLCVCVNVSDDE